MGNYQVGALKKQRRKLSQSSNNSSINSESLVEAERHPDWSVITEVPWEAWHNEVASVCGFDFHIQQTSKEHRVYKKPFTDNFVVTRKQDGIEKKMCTFTCKVCETGREEKVKTWVKNLAVLAYNSLVAVVQIILSKSVKLFVVNLQSGELLGTYSFAYFKYPCYQQCILSPDGTVVLTRQDYMLRRRLGHHASFDSDLRVLEVKGGICRRMMVLEDTLFQNSLGSAVAFDPRVSSRRVLMVSSLQQSLDNSHEGIRVIDLKKDLVINNRETPINHLAYSVTYSPDGLVFAVMVMDSSAFALQNYTRGEGGAKIDSVELFDSDSLFLLHSLSIYSSQPVRPREVLHFPTFSRSGEYLAQYTGPDKDSVVLVQVPILHISLQHLCRSVILRYVPLSIVGLLPLPKKLLDYLTYEPSHF